MKVKELIEELQKLNPDMVCIAKSPDGGYNQIAEIKVTTVIPTPKIGISYCQHDYDYDLMGGLAVEIISRRS